MKSARILAAACAVTFALQPAQAGGEGWSHDYEAARKQAVAEGKDLLIDFTGSDWCGWCIKLNDEVFQHDAFKSGVKDSFVLVELDFPKDASKLSEQTKKQNEELNRKYGVEGYPTVLLCAADGRPYAKTGYREGGPEKYVAHLNELRGQRAAATTGFAEAAALEGTEKANAIIATLKKLDLPAASVSNFYSDQIDQIKAADPNDEANYFKNLDAARKFSEIQGRLVGLMTSQKTKEAVELIQTSIGDFAGEQKQALWLFLALSQQQLFNFDESLKAMDEAKAMGGGEETLDQLDAVKLQIANAKTAFEERLKERSEKN